MNLNVTEMTVSTASELNERSWEEQMMLRSLGSSCFNAQPNVLGICQ